MEQCARASLPMLQSCSSERTAAASQSQSRSCNTSQPQPAIRLSRRGRGQRLLQSQLEAGGMRRG
eukprot:3076145-Rhodomonas_salina.1